MKKYSVLDFDHSVIVGSYAYEKRSYCYTRMVYNSTPAMEAKPQRIKSPNTNDYVSETVCTTSTIKIPSPHDGTVSTYSQLLDKSKGTNVIWANATIKGVNHMEEFNHKNTRAEFKKAIEDGGYAPETFKK